MRCGHVVCVEPVWEVRCWDWHLHVAAGFGGNGECCCWHCEIFGKGGCDGVGDEMVWVMIWDVRCWTELCESRRGKED